MRKSCFWRFSPAVLRSKEKRMTQIASPCLNICQLDPEADTCTGCGRTRAEIGGWMGMSADERAAIMARLAQTKQADADAS